MPAGTHFPQAWSLTLLALYALFVAVCLTQKVACATQFEVDKSEEEEEAGEEEDAMATHVSRAEAEADEVEEEAERNEAEGDKSAVLEAMPMKAEVESALQKADADVLKQQPTHVEVDESQCCPDAEGIHGALPLNRHGGHGVRSRRRRLHVLQRILGEDRGGEARGEARGEACGEGRGHSGRWHGIRSFTRARSSGSSRSHGRRPMLSHSMPFLLLPVITGLDTVTVANAGPAPSADEVADVLILGAGMSGVSAARVLHDTGYSFLLLEGRDEIGGRVRNHRWGEVPIELGANWISGARWPKGEHPMWSLAQQAKLQGRWDGFNTALFDGQRKRVKSRDSNYSSFVKARDCMNANARQRWESMRQSADITAGSFIDNLSVRDALHACSWSPRTAVDDFHEYFFIDWAFAYSPDRFSAFLGAGETYGTSDWFVNDPRGYKTIVSALGRPFLQRRPDSRLRLDRRVVDIMRPNAGGVRVTAVSQSGQTFTYGGRYAIVTFPVGVLQQGAVSFSPPLPAWKQEVLQQLKMAHFAKLFLEFDDVFWSQNEYVAYAGIRRGKPGYGTWPIWGPLVTSSTEVIYSYSDLPFDPCSKVLVGYCVDNCAVRAASAPLNDTVAEAMAALRQVYPDAPQPTRAYVTRWPADEWSYGAWVAVEPGVPPWAPRVLEYPVGQLFFSGEATSSDFYGYTHGAYLQGIHTAEMVLACLQGPAKGVRLTDASCPAAEFNASAVISQLQREQYTWPLTDSEWAMRLPDISGPGSLSPRQVATAVVPSVIIGFLIVAAGLCILVGYRCRWCKMCTVGLSAGTSSSDSKAHPEASAHVLSRLTFGWASSIVAAGKKRAIEQETIPRLPACDRAEHNAARLEAALKLRDGQFSFWAVHAAFWPYFWMTGLWVLLECLLVAGQPIMLERIVRYTKGVLCLSPIEAYVHGLALVVMSALQLLVLAQVNFRNERLQLRVAAAVGERVYQKVLALSSGEARRFGNGKLFSLMSSDAKTVAEAMQFVHVAWSAPLRGLYAVIMLYLLLGVAGLVGFAAMVLLLLLNRLLIKLSERSEEACAEASDSRLKLLGEVLSSIHSIKGYAWERPMVEKVHAWRTAELSHARTSYMYYAMIEGIWGSCTILASVVTFVTFMLMGNVLTAERAFAALAVYNVLEASLTKMPEAVQALVAMTVSAWRLRRLLGSPELAAEQMLMPAEPDVDSGSASSKEADSERATGEHTAQESQTHTSETRHYFTKSAIEHSDVSKLAIKVLDAELMWMPRIAIDDDSSDDGSSESDDDAAAGEDAEPKLLVALPSLQVPHGTFVGVCGPVGSGKSSLLHALLGELPPTTGSIHVRGTLAYCAQQPWLQHATVRENILFGEAMQRDRYERVVGACALNVDFEQLNGGDGCKLGDRGVTLSGGQMARVALARACYQSADVYILDDVLAAVDELTGAHLVQKCLHGLLLQERKATVVLATHQTKWLTSCDQLITLGDGPDAVISTGERALKSGSQPVAPGSLSSPEDVSVDSSTVSITMPANSRRDEMKVPRVRRPSSDEECFRHGAVRTEDWLSYVRALGRWKVLALLLAFVMCEAGAVVFDWWLANWVEHGGSGRGGISTSTYMLVYILLGVGVSVVTYTRCAAVAIVALNASKRIHESTLNLVMGSPLTFFNRTPQGRILNRFSNDIATIDSELFESISEALWEAMYILGTLTLLVIYGWWIIIIFVIFTPVCLLLGFYYMAAARQLQRLASVAFSRPYAVFSEALEGTVTIRAHQDEARFLREWMQRFDQISAISLMAKGAFAWLEVRLGVMCTAIIAIVTILPIQMTILPQTPADAGSSSVRPAIVGLLLTYALSLSASLSAFIVYVGKAETAMVSHERLVEYQQLPQEESDLAGASVSPVQSSPAVRTTAEPINGAISFSDVSMTYRVGRADTLHNLSFEIADGETVGICGRTGSGKSSLFHCLLRLVTVQKGSIAIGGVDITTLPVEQLRRVVAVIPQETCLFSGSLRFNLDPHGRFGEATVLQVVSECAKCIGSGVSGFFARFDIDDEATAALEIDKALNDMQLSVGERALIGLARAMLRTDAHVLLVDEATAALDEQTATRATEQILRTFQSRTVLAIAHRLETVAHYSRIIRMDAGCVLEDESTH